MSSQNLAISPSPETCSVFFSRTETFDAKIKLGSGVLSERDLNDWACQERIPCVLFFIYSPRFSSALLHHLVYFFRLQILCPLLSFFLPLDRVFSGFLLRLVVTSCRAESPNMCARRVTTTATASASASPTSWGRPIGINTQTEEQKPHVFPFNTRLHLAGGKAEMPLYRKVEGHIYILDYNSSLEEFY